MYDEIITLVKVTVTQDEIGSFVKTEERRDVYAESKSIGQSEFYQAAISKLNPEAKFVIPDYLDYRGERILEHIGYGEEKAQRYSVIRAYRSGNELELTCRKELGA